MVPYRSPSPGGDLLARGSERFVEVERAGRAIHASLRSDRVLESVIDEGMRALEAEAGTIWLLDREAERLLPVIAFGPKADEVKRLWLRPGEGIAGAVIQARESVLVENVRKVPQWAARFDNSSGFQTRTLLCVPLVHRDEAIGALQFINKRDNQCFGAEDLRLARALAGQAAVAIETSRVFEEQIVGAQEDERRRIARDIHDGPAQALAALVFRVDLCKRLVASRPEQALSELDLLKDQVLESLREVRGIISDLRPVALESLGLAGSLRNYLEGMGARSGPAASLSVSGRERRLTPSLEVTLYRLVQEAANNARKHARAATLSVRLDFGSDRVEAVVEDDGIGFDVAAALRQGGDHFGLAGMRERVELMDGTLAIDSASGRGTRISFTFPLCDRVGGATGAGSGARAAVSARAS